MLDNKDQEFYDQLEKKLNNYENQKKWKSS